MAQRVPAAWTRAELVREFAFSIALRRRLTEVNAGYDAAAALPELEHAVAMERAPRTCRHPTGFVLRSWPKWPLPPRHSTPPWTRSRRIDTIVLGPDVIEIQGMLPGRWTPFPGNNRTDSPEVLSTHSRQLRGRNRCDARASSAWSRSPPSESR